VTWKFRKTRKGDDFSDPISGEFFADGSTDNPATALVAEALQNALDAGRDVDRDGAPVRVSITLRRGSSGMSGSDAKEWFEELWPHLQCEGSGIKDAPDLDSTCDLLVIEDFGTCGLTGDIESDDASSSKNNFVDFLRSDGRTHKSAGDRGSWGVGKIVFPRSSQINGFIAFTVRKDDGKRLAMGKVILKIRTVAGEQYIPPCYYVKSWEDNSIPLPIDDLERIEQIRNAFAITRTDEPGLSIAVPWVDPEINFDSLLKAVVEKYAYAILAGQLAVTLHNGEAPIELDADSLERHTAGINEEDAAAIRLIDWSLKVDDADRLLLDAPSAEDKQRWMPELVPEAVRNQIREALAERKRVAIRFPLQVPKAGKRENVPAFFDAFSND
jgi:hypothetical protein